MSDNIRRLPPVLPGEGANDYARYMRTDALLALQKSGDDLAHHDELLFQTVHQTTELWLKHACFEVAAATSHVEERRLTSAVLLMRRAWLAIDLVTDALRMFEHMTPAAFQQVAAVLGNGSGLESPGWRGVRTASAQLGEAFDKLVADDARGLLEIYRGDPADPVYQLAEAIIGWDERINVWRVRHYSIAVRIRGAKAFGTGGNPIEMLNRLIHRRFFPDLWEIRDAIADREA